MHEDAAGIEALGAAARARAQQCPDDDQLQRPHHFRSTLIKRQVRRWRVMIHVAPSGDSPVEIKKFDGKHHV